MGAGDNAFAVNELVIASLVRPPEPASKATNTSAPPHPLISGRTQKEEEKKQFFLPPTRALLRANISTKRCAHRTSRPRSVGCVHP